ncbi:Pr6Pr family membrane protein [Brachybacterium ginsengisoli]|uniref:Pr6Pr family membrane protein n=1 Tax=Brachybacterium ginsengisoli TaxID=1331682 RepID=UPI001475B19D|nr:Pr6Pr family membrane protein [Brachybacterium ginsengisoli]
MRHLPAIARLTLALLILAALLTTLVQSAHDGLVAQNISYFTNQSNLLLAGVLVAGVVIGGRRPSWFADLRGAAAFYLAVTGIIYALLVAPLDELLRWDIGWTGTVLHRLAPLAAAADWMLTARRRAPSVRRILWWQAYPVVFLAGTWLRGGITGWYPYAFLDPTVSSWPTVLVTTVVVLAAFFAIASAVHLLEGRLARRRDSPQISRDPRRAAPAEQRALSDPPRG